MRHFHHISRQMLSGRAFSLLSGTLLTSVLWGIIPTKISLAMLFNWNYVSAVYAEKTTESIEVPSLWWIKDRLEQLDQPWIEKIMVDEKKVRVVVTSSLWIKANYLDRFSFLYKLGEEAQMLPQTYLVELTDRRNNVLGTYSIVNRKWRIASEQMENNPFRVTMPSIFNVNP